MTKVLTIATLVVGLMGATSGVRQQPTPKNDYSKPQTWLCRPGQHDACDVDLTATVVSADGKLTRETFARDPKAPIDCFYVYPTVSFGLDELDEEVATPAASIQDSMERLHFIIKSHAQLVTRGQGAITILFDEITALTPAQNRIITRRKRAYFNRLRELLKTLKAEGKLQDVDTTAATFSLLGMISWLSRWFRQNGALTEEQVADQISKIAFHGLVKSESSSKKTNLRVVKK